MTAAGDAAQSFDPLSGQGLLQALLSGEFAALTLIEEWPEDGLLSSYEKWLDEIWGNFLVARQSFYVTEQRWSGETFWRRRADSVAAATMS